MALDDAEERARAFIHSGLVEYADRRVASYEALGVDRLLQKDVLMLAMRGAADSRSFLELAFSAFESSSEEGMMGDFWQRVAADLTERAVDLSDLVLERDGDLWVVEIKAQPNTLTGRFRNALLRSMKRRVDQMSRHRRSRPGTVRAMLGVIRGKAADRPMTCKFKSDDEFADLDGFTYQYKVGRELWQWLTGHPSMTSLVREIPGDAARVVAARSAALSRLHRDLDEMLAQGGEGRDIFSVMRLAEARFG